MRAIRQALVLLCVPVLLGCSTARHESVASITAVTSDSAFGGEARFVGKLGFHGECVIARTGKKIVTPLFDRGVIVQPGGTVFDVGRGMKVPLGRRFQAGAAWFRENGAGWSVNEIERFFGVHIPVGCPTDTIVRLHDFKL